MPQIPSFYQKKILLIFLHFIEIDYNASTPVVSLRKPFRLQAQAPRGSHKKSLFS